MKKILPSCSQECMNQKISCKNKECRHWINYKKEHNCSMISIYLHGRMTLKQISERLGISIARVKQIEDRALQRIRSVIN
jgi:DNA-directed RNA polymerase sigma subunit (sigma70/sigma32)